MVFFCEAQQSLIKGLKLRQTHEEKGIMQNIQLPVSLRKRSTDVLLNLPRRHKTSYRRIVSTGYLKINLSLYIVATRSEVERATVVKL